MYTPTVSRKYSSNYSDSDTEKAAKYMEKPKLNLNRVVNKMEEEEKLRKLLGKDFAYDEDEQNDGRVEPLLLPRVIENPLKLKDEKSKNAVLFSNDS